MEQRPFITRSTIKNYKSFVSSDVRLQPVTFLVGRNGAGKSNFLDAFGFLADCLRGTFDEAVRARGGFAAVSHLAAGTYPGLSMRVAFRLRDGRTGYYRFAVSARPFGEPFTAPTLASEECHVSRNDGSREKDYFKVTNSEVQSNITLMPSAPRDRLYLVNASGIAPFEAIYNELSTMRIYRFGHHKTENGRVTGEESVLAWDGSNLAGVLLTLEKRAPHILERIQAYLRLIVPELEDVYVFPFGTNQYIGFRQRGQPGEVPHQRSFEQMSDGTVRALCMLVALFQGAANDPRSPRLIGIEEPEMSLHPAATAVLRDAIRDGAELAQVLVSTQSADLLDTKELAAEAIHLVDYSNGASRVVTLGDVARSAIKDHLYTAGELLRTGGISLPVDALS